MLLEYTSLVEHSISGSSNTLFSCDREETNKSAQLTSRIDKSETQISVYESSISVLLNPMPSISSIPKDHVSAATLATQQMIVMHQTHDLKEVLRK